MFEEILIAIVAIVAVIALIMVSGIRKVNQYEKGIIERWNAYEKTVDPGLRFVIPFVQRRQCSSDD